MGESGRGRNVLVVARIRFENVVLGAEIFARGQALENGF